MEWLETNFRPYNPEDEMLIDMFRVPIPKVDIGAFREALANALIHRDYHSRHAVYVRLNDDELTISNPGGLVEGVTLQNLLTTEPRPRNPALADAMKRIGIVERSGRGVDKIYRGLLRFGRPMPDYRRSDEHQVVVQLATLPADKAFLQLVVTQEKDDAILPIDSLIALAALREQKRLMLPHWQHASSAMNIRHGARWNACWKAVWYEHTADATAVTRFLPNSIAPKESPSPTPGRRASATCNTNKWCWHTCNIMDV